MKIEGRLHKQRICIGSYPLFVPEISGFKRMVFKKGSKTRRKRRGERGHPCLVPLVMGKGSERTPLSLIWADGVE